MFKIVILICVIVGQLVAAQQQRQNSAAQLPDSISTRNGEHRCGANQRFYECGACVGTCKTPRIACTLQCVSPGNCGCVTGYLRDTNDGGKCVPESSRQCIAQRGGNSSQQQNGRCAKTERFYPCGACDGTCAKPMRACTRECRAGECGCISGFVRDTRLKSRCVPRNSATCAAQRRS